ncbi:hypothetical protein BD413DRAFT_481651 [Trametes elegans]|nr:hypothetical protein BD413DRAFT_481651 [Trametes elegans]
MLNIDGLSRLFTRFLGVSPRKDCIDRLSNDVLLNEIMSYLDIFDILRLRRVSLLFYELSHDAALWKRLLRSSNIPLPPLPPTSRHTTDRMTALEVERLLCRAHSLDINWNRAYPRCLREWSFNAYHRILEMVALPGGRYLVASVTDPQAERYSLVVYAIDTFGQSRAIAKTTVPTKAYALRAKYVTVKGEKSIAIAYIRREYLHKEDRKKSVKKMLPDVSQYSTYYEPDVEFRYECITLHARLSLLEALTDLPYSIDSEEFVEAASHLPPPFENLILIRSLHRLSCPDLEEMFDSAYVLVVKQPNDLVMKRLDGGPSATLTCLSVAGFTQDEHTIKAARFVPQDGSVFVVREIDVPRTQDQRCPLYAFETYRAIPAGPDKIVQSQNAEGCRIASDVGRLTHVHIADPLVPPRDDDSLLGQLRRRKEGLAGPHLPPPPPLTVLARRVDEEGFVCVRFFAQRYTIVYPPTPPSAGVAPRPHRTASRVQVSYRYTLQYNDIFEQDAPLNENVRVVPALARPLLVYTPWDDITDSPRVLAVRPFVDRGMLRPPALVGDAVVPERGLRSLATFADGPRHVDRRVTAFAWDETIGRLFMALEGEDELLVYEFAHSPSQIGAWVVCCREAWLIAGIWPQMRKGNSGVRGLS